MANTEVEDREAQDVERAESLAKLLAQGTSWEPLDSDTVRHIVEGGIDRPAPTIFRRDDGSSLIYPGRTHLFMGEPEGNKTWTALHVCAQEIRAGNAAIFIDFEDEAVTAIERLIQLGLTEEEIVNWFLYIRPEGPFDVIAQAHLDARIGLCDRTVSVAVIDSMTEAMAMHGLDPDKGTNVAEFYHGLPRSLMYHDLAVIMIDHVVKSHEGRGRWAIGSERKISGLTGAALVFEALVPFGRGMTGKVKVTLSKDRPGSVRPLTGKGKGLGTITFQSDPDTGDVAVSFDPPGETNVVELAAKLIEATDRMRRETWQVIDEDQGIGTRELRRRVTGQTDAKNDTRLWLIENGYVETRPNGKATGHYTVKPLEAS